MSNERAEQQDRISEELSLWRSLVDSAAWKRLEGVIRGQIKNRSLLSPLRSMDEVLEQEFRKGEIAFAELILALPGIELDKLRQESDKLQKEIDDEAKYEQYSVGADGASRSSTERWGRGDDGNPLDVFDSRVDPFGDASAGR